MKQSHVVLVITLNEQLILILLEWNYGFLKVHWQAFLLVPKIAKKWWLSWLYLELKKAKIPRETATTTATMMATTTLKTKVHSQGFVMIPKNCQKVMVIMVICHLKSCLTFVRAPCNAGFEREIWKLPLALIKKPFHDEAGWIVLNWRHTFL